MARAILVVEDNAADRARLEQLLGAAGYQVRTAQNGQEALDAVRSARPDAILMDVNMPGMDGFAATRSLQKEEATKGIPVIMVSAKDQKADKAWASMLGAKGYVTKPYTDEQLLAEVRAV